MASDPLAGVPLLAARPLARGERWVFSAGFNVPPALSGAATARIDSEAADLARLSDAGARVALLSHQGSHRDGTAGHLPHVAAYLSRVLERPVRYHPENASPGAVRAARRIRDGEIVLFGNTRLHAGEERGDPELARTFAELGDYVAVGGFSKAHRAHASNTGLLDHLPGWAAGSLAAEVRFLAPWAAGPGGAAVLGGRKPEKTLVGFAEMVGRLDLVVPAGVVLNTVLRALGHDVGASELGERPEACLRAARAALDAPGRTRVHVPTTVFTVPADQVGTEPARPVRIADGVPRGHAVVDFAVEPWALTGLSGAQRVLLAGTPSRHLDGYTHASEAILRALPADALLLGGDTTTELPWRGPASTGGGSALQFLVEGTTSVLDALRSRTESSRRTA
ncbi:phosphoglycerate kinase [Streptomyces arenae]|uniref:phosphoglycerate kinase n=1 Tax=Streptomyces arenae TaxID=29301 RepID=UPI00265ABF29|nr:phosphoglycerate kinase [Streptomyces arenae]MCG7206615.1 phosphoglycerate kinase [Streptomyces arenae]